MRRVVFALNCRARRICFSAGWLLKEVNLVAAARGVENDLVTVDGQAPFKLLISERVVAETKKSERKGGGGLGWVEETRKQRQTSRRL